MVHADRIIILVDADCFYCQVEEKLDPSLAGRPIAVVQFNAWRDGGWVLTLKNSIPQGSILGPF